MIILTLKNAKPKSDCGANAEGGGGFQPGNDCASGDRGSQFTSMPKGSKEKAAADKYFKSLKTQKEYSDAIRDASYERGAFFDSKGNLIGEETTDYKRTSINYNDREIPAGATYVHNHPSGGSLSDSDVFFAIANDQRIMIAVSHKGDYEMTFPKNAADKLHDAFKKERPSVYAGLKFGHEGESMLVSEGIKKKLISKKTIGMHIAQTQYAGIEQMVKDKGILRLSKTKLKDFDKMRMELEDTYWDTTHQVFQAWANDIGFGVRYKKSPAKK